MISLPLHKLLVHFNKWCILIYEIEVRNIEVYTNSNILEDAYNDQKIIIEHIIKFDWI